MRHKLLVVIFLSIACPAFAAHSPHPAVSRHKQELAQKDYTRALLVLNRALRPQQTIPIEQKIEILILKAEFYQKYIADLEQSAQILEQARREISETDPDLKKEVENKLEVVRSVMSRYRDQKAFIDQFGTLSGEKKKTKVAEIEDRLAGIDPNDPYKGVLTHCLGEALFEAKKYHAAHNAFFKAMEISPGIYFNYSTRQLMESSYSLWKQHTLAASATVTMSILLGLIVLGVFASRPLRWVRWVHLFPLPILIVTWTLAHRGLLLLSMLWADTSIPEGDDSIVNAHSGFPLSEPLVEHLFIYGLIAALAIYFATLAVSRIKYPMTRYLANACVAFFITGSLMICFVLNHADVDIVLGQNSPFTYMGGSYRYKTTDPLPYLLSDPRSFGGLAVQNLDEQTLKEYFRNMEYAMEGDNE